MEIYGKSRYGLLTPTLTRKMTGVVSNVNFTAYSIKNAFCADNFILYGHRLLPLYRQYAATFDKYFWMTFLLFLNFNVIAYKKKNRFLREIWSLYSPYFVFNMLLLSILNGVFLFQFSIFLQHWPLIHSGNIIHIMV